MNPAVLARTLGRKLLAQRGSLGLIAAFLLPLFIATYYLDAETKTWQTFTQQEKDGLAYTRQAKDVIDLVQKHRGNTQAYLNGDRTFREAVSALGKKIDASLNAMHEQKTRLGLSKTYDNRWRAIEADWALLKKSALRSSTQENFARHTALIADIRSLVNDVVDSSNLILDPEHDSYHAVSLLLGVFDLTEAMGRARASGVVLVWRGSPTGMERNRFNELLGTIEHFQESVAHEAAKLAGTEDNRLAATLEQPFQDSRAASKRFLEMARSQIGQAKRARIGASEYMNLATKEIDAQYRLFDVSAGALESLLDARLRHYAFKRAATGVFLLFVTVLAFVAYTRFMRYQQALHASEERFALAVRGTSDGIWDWDLRGKHIYFSPRWKAMLGYAPGEISDDIRGWQEIIYPDDLGRFLEAWAQAAEGMASGFEVEYRLRRKNGGYAWILCRGLTLYEGGDPARIVGAHTDISDRKRLTEALRDAEERTRAIVEAAADGIVTADEQGTILSFNGAAEVIFQAKRGEIVGRSVNVLMTPADATDHDQRIQRYLHTGAGQILGVGAREVTGRRADGGAFPMDLSISEAFVGGARVFIAIVRDVSERRHVQDALNEALQERETIMNTAPDIIFKLDFNGKLVAWNRRLEEVTGHSALQLRQRPFFELLPKEERVEAIAATERCFVQGKAEVEVHLVQRDGEAIPHRLRASALKDARGQIAGLTGVGRDVSREKRAEEEMAWALERATEASRTKSTFLARMSHELRTPLNAIIGFSGVLLQGMDGPVNDEQQNSLKLIQSSGQHLLAIINDILDLSKIEAGRMELKREPIDLLPIVAEAAATVEHLAHARGIDLTQTLAGEMPPVHADRVRLKQVLLNLLSNAVKFTDRGEVSVMCEAVSGDDPRLPQEARTHVTDVMALVAVRDSGIGIAEADAVKLFESFRQLDAGQRRGGTGLGLAISKRFIEMHDGAIWVESRAGQGTTFYFTLPFAQAVSQTARQESQA